MQIGPKGLATSLQYWHIARNTKLPGRFSHVDLKTWGTDEIPMLSVYSFE